MSSPFHGQIRPAVPADFEQVNELVVSAYASAYEMDPATEGSYLKSPYITSLRNVQDRAEKAIVLVAEVHGRVVATITYVPGHTNRYAEFDDPQAVGIRMLAVAEDSRRRGIARLLVQECCMLARAHGKSRVILHTTQWMSVAAALYLSMGFIRSPDRDIQDPMEGTSEHTPGIPLLAYELAV